MPHAVCVEGGATPRHLSFGGAGGHYVENSAGCIPKCSAGFHMARCALGCIECRRDGSEVEASVSLSWWLAFIIIVFASVLFMQARERLRGCLIDKLKLFCLNR